MFACLEMLEFHWLHKQIHTTCKECNIKMWERKEMSLIKVKCPQLNNTCNRNFSVTSPITCSNGVYVMYVNALQWSELKNRRKNGNMGCRRVKHWPARDDGSIRFVRRSVPDPLSARWFPVRVPRKSHDLLTLFFCKIFKFTLIWLNDKTAYRSFSSRSPAAFLCGNYHQVQDDGKQKPNV